MARFLYSGQVRDFLTPSSLKSTPAVLVDPADDTPETPDSPDTPYILYDDGYRYLEKWEHLLYRFRDDFRIDWKQNERAKLVREHLDNFKTAMDALKKEPPMQEWTLPTYPGENELQRRKFNLIGMRLISLYRYLNEQSYGEKFYWQMPGHIKELLEMIDELRQIKDEERFPGGPNAALNYKYQLVDKIPDMRGRRSADGSTAPLRNIVDFIGRQDFTDAKGNSVSKIKIKWENLPLTRSDRYEPLDHVIGEDAKRLLEKVYPDLGV